VLTGVVLIATATVRLRRRPCRADAEKPSIGPAVAVSPLDTFLLRDGKGIWCPCWE
jgi:hypothetical protein